MVNTCKIKKYSKEVVFFSRPIYWCILYCYYRKNNPEETASTGKKSGAGDKSPPEAEGGSSADSGEVENTTQNNSASEMHSPEPSNSDTGDMGR